MYGRLAIEPKVFDGPPPKVLVQDPVSNDYLWRCECGDRGTSSSKEWAHSDVNRHRGLKHNVGP